MYSTGTEEKLAYMEMSAQHPVFDWSIAMQMSNLNYHSLDPNIGWIVLLWLVGENANEDIAT